MRSMLHEVYVRGIRCQKLKCNVMENVMELATFRINNEKKRIAKNEKAFFDQNLRGSEKVVHKSH